MQYDFTSILERRGMDAIAVDAVVPGEPTNGFAPGGPREGFDVIPMWVADMNFPVFPGINQAISGRLDHPTFGYFHPRQEYYDAIIRWQKERNGVTDLTPDDIGYENGVLGGVVSAMNALANRGGKVLVHSPTYIGFTHSLEDNGYKLVHSPLVKDAEGIFRMDLADMEEKLRTQQIHVAILCSPHNPCGRVWERWELEQAMELFRKYNVYVISDEIWSDIIRPGHKHIPTQSVSEDAKRRTVALYAPSKTFSLAGLIGSYHIIYDPWLRDRIRAESSLCHYNSMNVLSMYALIGAFTEEGMEWTNQLCGTIAENIDYACDYIAQNFAGIAVSKPQGTYMLFLDCTQWCQAHGLTMTEVLNRAWEVGVAVQDGRMFHGPCHIRMNLALPLSRVKEAMERLRQYVFI